MPEKKRPCRSRTRAVKRSLVIGSQLAGIGSTHTEPDDNSAVKLECPVAPPRPHSGSGWQTSIFGGGGGELAADFKRQE